MRLPKIRKTKHTDLRQDNVISVSCPLALEDCLSLAKHDVRGVTPRSPQEITDRNRMSVRQTDPGVENE